MKALMKSSIYAVLISLVMISCGDNKNETAFKPGSGVKPSSDDQTLTIKLAINETYCKKTACVCVHETAAREYEEVVKMLKDKHNIDLQLTYFVESYEMEDALRAKAFDGVICKPWTAYMLSPENGVTYKRIADITDAYNSPWLTGVFWVLTDSPIKTIEDIKGKTMVIGQKDSYEKYHEAYYSIDKHNMQPGKIYEKASCLESINELMEHRAEVAVVSDYTMKADCAVDLAEESDFRTIVETERMPLCSVILDMAKVSEADALRLQNALLAVSGKNAPESMLSDGFVKPASWIVNPYVKKND
jgi:ABC-type phosphate/phosphonate transport system substrate-binding protein